MAEPESDDTAAWVLPARHFVSTRDERWLADAIGACRDGRITQFLRSLADLERWPEQEEWEPLARALDGAGRKPEALAVNLLGIRHLGEAALHPEQLTEDRAQWLAAQCAAAAQASAALGFAECEAYFALALGRCSAHHGNLPHARRMISLSVETLRALVRNDPMLHEPSLADALNASGMAASDDQDYEAARHHYDESLEIARRLADRDPARHGPGLAVKLNNLGNLLRQERRYAEALAVLEEAVGVAGTAPDSPLLATIFSNLGIVHYALRNFPAAGRAHMRTVSIREAAAAREPDHPSPDLAFSYHNLASVLAELGDLGEARRLLLRALEIRTNLVQSGLASAFPFVARTLVNLGSVEMNDGKPELAAETFAKAVEAYRTMAANGADEHRAGLASALVNLGSARAALGQHEHARPALREAITMLRDLTGVHPAAYQMELALALANLATLDETEGDDARALAGSREAIYAAEAPSLAADESWLVRGQIAGAYGRVLQQAILDDDRDLSFRCLAALRDGTTQIGSPDPADSLQCATAALAAVAARVGRPVRLLVAQDLDSAFLIAILGPGPEPPRFIRCDGFAAAAPGLFDSIYGVFENGARDHDGVIEGVRRAARDAWDSLPEAVRELLDPSADHDVLISADARWSVFPWEALRFGPDGDSWLGLHRPLARWGPLLGGALGGLAAARVPEDPPCAVVLSPWDATAEGAPRLPHAKLEAEAVGALLGNAGFSLLPDGGPLLGERADYAAVDQALAASPAVIHFAGHGTVAVGEEALVVHRGDSSGGSTGYGREAMRLLQARLRRDRLLENRPLVVLNSCRTGGVRSFGGKREDLCFSLINAGAGAVVASAFPVFDRIGAELGRAFYENALRVGVGDALVHARRSIERWASDNRHASWAAWALVTCHGDPYIELPHADD